MTTCYDDNNGPEPITDELARLVWADSDQSEPLPGSVVLIGGDWGTAWQRHHHDGLWHSTRPKGAPKPWSWMLNRRNLRLAYDAEPRPEWTDSPVAPTHLTGADIDALLSEKG